MYFDMNPAYNVKVVDLYLIDNWYVRDTKVEVLFWELFTIPKFYLKNIGKFLMLPVTFKKE